jgi:hypothetical protein
MSEVEARGQFVIGTDDELPAGKVVHVVEHEGSARIHYAKGHASQELCDQLNAYHVGILEEAAQWKQDWTDDPDRLQPGKVEKAPIATARYVLVPGAALPRGRVCFPIEVDGEFIWLVRDKEDGIVHMSPEAIEGMNDYLRIVVEGGLWKQQD